MLKERVFSITNFLKNNLLLIIYFCVSIIFSIPSVIYLLQNKTILYFIHIYSYLFIDSSSNFINTVNGAIYIIIFLALFALYFAILKNVNKIFKSKKKMFIFIFLIGVIFSVIIPVTSLDIYSYIGNGWVDSNYNENPYYVPVQSVLDKNGFDEMLVRVARCWKEETVVYGPAWSLVCKAITFLSFGKITNAVYLFKLIYLLVFMACSILIYKITRKKIFTVMFALNPYVLFEFMTNVHNDIFLVLLILLAIYFVNNKKNAWLAVACLAVATAMKYLSILLIPFLIIYSLRNEKNIKNKIIKTIAYSLEFCFIILVFYMIYVKDIEVLKGIFIQQNKYERSIMLILWYMFDENETIMSFIKICLLSIFAILYATAVFKLFFKKEKSSFINIMQTYQTFILIFTFILITNFNAWYIVWLFPTLMWQKSKIIRSTLYISLGGILSYSLTYFTKIESREIGVKYFIVMVLTLMFMICRRKFFKTKITKKIDGEIK